MRRIVALAVVGLVVSGCARQGAPASAPPVPAVGKPAPAFKLPSANGNVIALEDLRGSPILLYFSMGPG
jgi:cytochrome oxidase Cu insertion factor (SCO1/SenC/PrrC family)